MYPSVQAAWFPFNKQLEGYLTFLYLDILGYVTTGMGNLVDPAASALSLPWKNADGSDADQATILAAWTDVDMQRSDPKGKRQTSGLATRFGQAFSGVTSIRLTEDGVVQTVLRQVAANEATLAKYFLQLDTMPADGQMMIHSMAWAMGAGFPQTFTAFRAAVNGRDWLKAKANGAFRGAGVQKRIDANLIMAGNAAAVLEQGLDPSVLYYPRDLQAEAASPTPAA